MRRMYETFHSGYADGALAHLDPDVVVIAVRPNDDRGSEILR
jgi:hypothetical protein